MHLFALVLTLCNMQTMQCENYVARLYTTQHSCQFDAIGVRTFRKPGPLFVRCLPIGAKP